MKKNKLSKSTAKGIATVLEVVLHAEANSASCMVAYQPKAPKELAQYTRRKK